MSKLPLTDIKVIEVGQLLAGPFAGTLLAYFGADVIKVEPVNGERLRGAGGAKTPLSFAMLNSNKKSITLNLQDEEGKELLLQQQQCSFTVCPPTLPIRGERRKDGLSRGRESPRTGSCGKRKCFLLFFERPSLLFPPTKAEQRWQHSRHPSARAAPPWRRP